MSEHLHPGLHPDPDSLSAFIEGVLPEHERFQCLAHLAECSRCREVVFLAQAPRPAPAASNPVPAWRRWFAPTPVFAAAAACIAVLVVGVYLHYRAGAPARDAFARVKQVPAVPAPPSAADSSTAAQVPKPVKPKATSNAQTGAKLTARRTISATARSITVPSLPLPSLPPPPQIPAQSPPLVSAIPLPSTSPRVNIRDDRTPADGLSGIAGTVTDATGAAIAGATIQLRQLAGTISSDARTDVMGRFKLAGLPAGRYEIQITAPGFRQTLRQIDLQSREVATVNSELAVGSVAETVEVTAATPAIQASTSTVRSEPRRKPGLPAGPRLLPSKLPATSTVIRGKVMLVVDSVGAVFVSRNSGKSWKAVKPVWRGKAVRVVTPPEPSQTSTPVFQLTTDTDSTWLSRDGSHWYPALPQR